MINCPFNHFSYVGWLRTSADISVIKICLAWDISSSAESDRQSFSCETQIWLFVCVLPWLPVPFQREPLLSCCLQATHMKGLTNSTWNWLNVFSVGRNTGINPVQDGCFIAGPDFIWQSFAPEDTFQPSYFWDLSLRKSRCSQSVGFNGHSWDVRDCPKTLVICKIDDTWCNVLS